MVLQKLCFNGLRGFEVEAEEQAQALNKEDKRANILKGIPTTMLGDQVNPGQAPNSACSVERSPSVAYEVEQTPQSGIVQSIELESNAEIKLERDEDEDEDKDEQSLTPTPEEVVEGAIVLNPKKSKRQYWTDPATRVQREIWRPGDGDGDKAADYFDKPGKQAPLEKRWRFYQSPTGMAPIKRDVNEPPKYVVLDDRTVHELLESDVPRSHLKQYWGYDFGSTGIVRARRPHRGRSAVRDPTAVGDARYHFTAHKNNISYHFTGEKFYTPIIWRTSDPALAISAFKPPKRGFPSPPKRTRPLSPNKHGHNQFTPKDQMVKYGAPHKGASYLRYRNRLNTFLPREKTPPTLGRKTGRSALTALSPTEASQLPSSETEDTQGKRKRSSDEFMFVGQSDSDNTPAKKNKTADGTAQAPIEMASDEGQDTGMKEMAATGQDDDDDDPLGLSVLAEEYIPGPVRPLQRMFVKPPDVLGQMLMDREESEESLDVCVMRKADGTVIENGADDCVTETHLFALRNRLQTCKDIIAAKNARILKLESELAVTQDRLAEKEMALQPVMEEGDGEGFYTGEPEGGEAMDGVD